MSTEAAPVQAVSSVVTAELLFDCQKNDHGLDAWQPPVMMVRARRGESERAMTLALAAVMTAISAVHQKAARALFRFRKLIGAGSGMIFRQRQDASPV